MFKAHTHTYIKISCFTHNLNLCTINVKTETDLGCIWTVNKYCYGLSKWEQIQTNKYSVLDNWFLGYLLSAPSDEVMNEEGGWW